MEAEWEFEVGGDAPVIEAYWPGFIDLREHPERVSELTECRAFPSLADVLIRLNAPDSPVWTSKTDVFTPATIDPDEMNASPEAAAHALACYIDLLQRSHQVWNLPVDAERDCKQICAHLSVFGLRCCRVDIVVRRALAGDRNELAATVYLSACGPTLDDAKHQLGECLAAFADVVAAPPSLSTRRAIRR
jgi:hypothetical protein